MTMNKFLSVLAVIAAAGFASQAAVAKDEHAAQGKGQEKVCVVANEDGKAKWLAKPAADKQIADGKAVAVSPDQCPAQGE
jgi:hypothetical protein